ncbi:50S ribosomal protein L29 [Candidatus Woesebacteria bacterium RIFCSPHIGHO2_01_FULL_39_28]|uniref:Large ribosomal subunit protein uL29 n=1 Tax=Candidatus Woesebacteria bacterium RIFCSPHIGHO2_01_FULL_39_28 TaxID=1802496 RepID=A0A1F7YBE9_9BACT|nr:MAG: 50S ribosomal protein L29 [Candidatus Woesebacteria bacterium RIFCSPHIGHO2_01_FULL_39_28]OGM58467.1 MAG: 50S ribosomal protein L29 [Candidatus Woesebacteria bacterium RIFCSPLOWO2_01_FULL_38_20]
MKVKDLRISRQKTLDELKKVVLTKKNELDRTLVKKNSGQQNLKISKFLKRDIAQILTIIREKELSPKEELVSRKKGAK